jgi:hypothetical protein
VLYWQTWGAVMKWLAMLLVLSSTCVGNALAADSVKNEVMSLRYPRATSEQVFDHNGILGRAFLVTAPYPTTDVVVFYDKALRRMGFRPATPPGWETEARSWSSYLDGTIPGSPMVFRYMAFWSLRDLSVTLLVRYIDDNPVCSPCDGKMTPSVSTQSVVVNVVTTPK